MIERVTDRLRQGRAAGQSAKQIGQPGVHGLDQGTALLLTLLPAVVGRLAADVGLDRIQRADPLQSFQGKRRLRCRKNVVELPPCMRPTKGQRRSVVRAGDKTAKSGVTIDLKQPAEAFQMARRMLALAIFAVGVGSRWMTRPRPRTIIDCIAPQPSGFGAAAAGVQHRQGGIVGNHLRRGQNRAQDQLIQRLQPPAGASDPVAQSGTIQLHALAGEDLRLAIQRKVVGKFADQHLRQQRLGRQAAVNRPLRRGRLRHAAFAAAAAIARAANHPHPKLRGDDIQHFGAVFADLMQGRAAARAGLVGDIDHDLDPRQMRRQRSAIALRRLAGPLRLRLSRLGLRFLLAQGLLGIFNALLQRFFAETFGAAAEAVAQQNRDQHLQARNLGLRLEQQMLQQRRIVGQGGLIGGHGGTLNRRCESGPLNLA